MRLDPSSKSEHSFSHRAWFRAALFACALGTLLLGSRPALALNACVPPPRGVVGMSGPPDPTAPSPSVDDPRWHGAAGVGFPDLTAAGAPDAQARLVQTGGSLYLQVHVLADANPGNIVSSQLADAVYVAFADATLATINVVRIAINASGGTQANRWTKTGGVWSAGIASPGTPAWLTGFTAWVNPPMNGAATSENWAVAFKIDTALLPGTKFWYGTSISPSPLTMVQTYAWPSAGGFEQPVPANVGLPAADWGALFDAIGAANWGDYTTTTGVPPLPAGCDGVRIESDDIGTTNSPSYYINDDANNTFRAQLSGTLPGVGAVKARFRIANWGTQIGVGGDWHDIPVGTYAHNRTNNASGLIEFTCNFIAGECPTLTTVGATNDQCMLVELQPAAGPVTFTKDSAWRNMIFGPASTFEHPAEISLVGLPAETTPRDVYLYVKASNMPATIDAPKPGQNPDRPSDLKRGAASAAQRDPFYKYRVADFNYTRRRIYAGQPTYEVRAYRDTGKGTGGVQLLTPMVPFGYYIEHNGPLFGWRHELTGVGTTVTTVIPNVLYKVSVLPGGKVQVNSKIEALEQPAGPPPVPPCSKCSCDFRKSEYGSAYFALAALVGLALLKRRRTREARRAA